MRATLVFGLISAICLCSSAFAAEKLVRPISVQDGRWAALSAVKVNPWRSGSKVSLLGFSPSGKTTVVRVTNPSEMPGPATVTLHRRKTSWGYTHIARPPIKGMKLMRPVSVPDGRQAALKAAGFTKGRVNLVGFTTKGRTVVMVKPPRSAAVKPALVMIEATASGEKATLLNAKTTRSLKLIPASEAFGQVLRNRGRYAKVTGKVAYAGGSSDGLSYKFTVTPKKPVAVKDAYGTTTVKELVRMVNVLGRGETAYPSKSEWKHNSK